MSNAIDPKIIVSAFKSFGVYFVKKDMDNNIIYVSLPESSDCLNATGSQMAGSLLAKRVKESLKDLNISVDVAYKVRKGDHWTKDKGNSSIEESFTKISENAISSNNFSFFSSIF